MRLGFGKGWAFGLSLDLDLFWNRLVLIKDIFQMKFTRTIVVNSENPRTDPAFVPKYLSRTYDDNFDSPRVDFDLFFINSMRD